MKSLGNKSTNRVRPLKATDRDRQLLQALDEFRVLTTDQVHHLFFPSLHRTRKRLVRLWRHGLVVRDVRPTQLGEGSSQYYYALSQSGRRMLPQPSNHHGTSYRTLYAFSRHSEQINNFRICLTLATNMADDLALSSWAQGRKLKMLAAPRYPLMTQPMPIIPDAMFILLCRGREYNYFLEFDRGTTDLGRIANKCAGYHWLWQQKTAHRRFGIRSFRVLLVTTTRRRLDHIIQKLVDSHSHSSCPDLIACTDFDLVSLNQPQRLFAANWQTVSDTGSSVSAWPLPAPSFNRSRQSQEHHLCTDQNPDASCKEPPGPADEGAARLPGSGSG